MKSGTPTMGGVVILLLWGASLSLLHWLQGLSIQSVFILSAGVTCGLIGLMDDLFAQRRRRSLGLSPLQKVLLVTLASVLLFLVFPPEIWNMPLNIPFSSLKLLPPSTFLGFLLFWFVFTAITNSMNLTDGLDGLATGTTLLILIGFLVLAPQVSLPSLLPLVGILIGFLLLGLANLLIPAFESLGLDPNVGMLALTLAVLAIMSLVMVLRPAPDGETALRRCGWLIGAFTLLTQNLFSWYMLWMLPLVALFVRPGRLFGLRAGGWTGWWLFCGLVGLSYSFFIRWRPVPAALWLQFLPLYGLLLWDAGRSLLERYRG